MQVRARTMKAVTLAMALALSAGVGVALAQTGPTRFAYTFPDPNTQDGSPDPSVWGRDGTLTPTPDAALGVGIIDPDNASKLLFFASPGVLGSETATFRVQVDTPPVPDNSPAWVNHALGWRLILDDGTSRLELALARDPASTPMRKVLRVENAPNVALIPFPWDNDFHNVYEIGRVTSGDFVIAATNKDPAATTQLPPVTIPGNALPGTSGAVFAWGTGLAGGGVSFWQNANGEVATDVVTIGVDTKELTIDLGATAAENEIEWKGVLNLPAGSTINPVNEAVSIKLANAGGILFETAIGANNFTTKRDGSFKYESASGTTPKLEVKFKPMGGTAWEFKMETEDLPLTVADRTQVTGTLAIGNKTGSQTMPLADLGDRLQFEKP